MFTTISLWNYFQEKTELEIFLERFYKQHGQYFPLEYYPPCHNDAELFQLVCHFFEEHKKYPHPEELSEEKFFPGEIQVQLERHYRYMYSVLHMHAFYEMVYVLQGECQHEVDNQAMLLQKGDLCIIPPEVAHSVTVNSDSIVINILLRASSFTEQFSGLLRKIPVLSEFFHEIIYSDIYKRYLLFHTGEDELLFEQVLEMYVEQENKAPCYESILNGQFVVFLGKLLQRHQASVEYPQNYAERFSVIPQIISYIHQNCCNITLQSCAEAYHFNPQYLSRILKKETGKSFSSILMEEKMQKAGGLLRESSLSVRQTSELLGFADSSYFMKVFKKYFGCTPSVYRQRYAAFDKI